MLSIEYNLLYNLEINEVLHIRYKYIATNQWLFISDSHRKESSLQELQRQTSGDRRKEQRCSCLDNYANKIIAISVIAIQISAYVVMTQFLIQKTETENTTRSESCYGPNCDASPTACMELTTGGLTSILLVVKYYM